MLKTNVRLCLTLAAGALLLLAQRAGAIGESDPIVFSGETHLLFQNGRFPVSTWQGMTVLGIDSGNTGQTVGDMSSAADSLVILGDARGDDATQRILVQLSDFVPWFQAAGDSAEVIEARLGLFEWSETYSATQVSQVGFYRLWRTFTAPTWLNRAAATPWFDAGVIPPPGVSLTRWDAFGASQHIVRGPLSGFGSGELQPLWKWQVEVYTGSDSLYDGTGQVATFEVDACPRPDWGFSWSGQTTLTQPSLWWFDVTPWARAVLEDRWNPATGFLMALDPMTGDEISVSATFRGCLPALNPSGLANPNTPVLWVRFLKVQRG